MRKMKTAAKHLTSIVVLMLLSVPLCAPDAQAQDENEDKMQGILNDLTIGANIGSASFGRFLEERLGETGERELTASSNITTGLSVDFRPWTKLGVRAFGSYTPTDLEFEEDTGFEFVGVPDPDFDFTEDELEGEDLRNMRVWNFGLEAVRYADLDFFGFTPYITIGFTGNVWSIDDERDDVEAPFQGIIVADDNSLFRWGAMSTLGFEVKVMDGLGLRLEGTALRIRSPFDGDDSWRIRTETGQEVFDEPSAVRQLRLTAGLAYTL